MRLKKHAGPEEGGPRMSVRILDFVLPSRTKALIREAESRARVEKQSIL